MPDETADMPQGFTERDILFECPYCGKSLGIDEQGAGLVVPCPQCGNRMQVPVPDHLGLEPAEPGVTSTADYREAVATDVREEVLQERVHRLQVTMEEVQVRKRYLEKLRIDHALRFERVREEMALIQAALDRMTDLLQDMPDDRSGT